MYNVFRKLCVSSYTQVVRMLALQEKKIGEEKIHYFRIILRAKNIIAVETNVVSL